MDGPILFHCVTRKGKGYPYAEEDPLTYHGVRPYDVDTGQFLGAPPGPSAPKVPSFTEVFATKLVELAKEDDRIVAITAGMPTGTGLDKFEAAFEDRFFDVGICEQHAVTFAAGLAARGMRPVAAIYSTFLQRAYDQFIHDVCLQNLPVVFAIDRAGLVGEDSPTQQGAFDLSFLRAIPNFTLFTPRDDIDLALMLAWAVKQSGPVGFRFARSEAPAIGAPEGRDITRGEMLREGADAVFVAVGPVLGNCLKAAKLLEKEGLSVGVADARRVKPLDANLIDSLVGLPIITVEENTLSGGFGSAVLEHFEAQGRLGQVRIRRAGIPDRFLDHMTREEQLQDIGLDAEGLARTAREFLGVPAKGAARSVPSA
jgi:1-deoxy-D-xylulose-5-phosphate synthase